MSQDDLTPHRAIANRIKDLRKKRGWSAAHLAAEMAKVGIAWDRSIVANFESGRRAALSVEEFFALAYVLSVAPVHLAVPVTGDDEPYAVVSGVAADRATVRAWIRGETEPFGDPRINASEAPESERGPDMNGMVRHVQLEGKMAELGVPDVGRIVRRRSDSA